MARKPTRIWHPAQRLLSRVNEAARGSFSRRNQAAQLDDVRTRLQHYLRAMYDQPITIESLAPAKKGGLATRTLAKLASPKNHSASESNAESIRLPAVLPRQRADVSALEQYRVIAVQHAERIRRSSARHARDAATDLERDLFQLAEAAAIDTQIAANQPGLSATLDAARADAMAHRPTPRRRTGIELRVEEMFRRAWSANDNDAIEDTDLPTLLPANDAESNAEWARRAAKALETKYGAEAARGYRRMPEMTLWDTTITTQLPEDQAPASATHTHESTSERARAAPAQKTRTRAAVAGPTQPGSPQDKRGGPSQQSGGDDSSARAETSGKAAPGDEREEADTERDANDESADTTQTNSTASPGDEAGVEYTEGTANETPLTKELTYRYPEWDCYAHGFTAAGTIVRIIPPSLESSEWATHALQEHVREVQHAKRQFERLRSHRMRLRRQLQGDELDLEACVEAMVDRRMRIAPTDRLYSHVRPGRRELAITLLLDVSGSTRAVVAGERRVIDIERIAALVATAAFDALGDDYSILAFSSEGASNVRVHTLKSFGESNSSLVLQRISALVPDGTTRLGAAVRHATAMLTNHPAPHRLLLILSDGKPHDYDLYSVDYAIQDSRHAVMNARLQGIHPFCITVDASDGETYLAEIFGSAGYRVVSKPSQLSQALLLAVQRLIGGSD
ncbi:MAG: von Willebrand factor type [Gemmatimonadetes bacterium]|nr:von Willebrand factor type [Gemmatimonadota bacterium]